MPHPLTPRLIGTPSRRAAAGVVVAVTALAPLASSAPAHAEPAPVGQDQQPVVVVMDYSGSMLNGDADAEGITRVDAAKTAAKDLVDATPEGSQLGLVAYGHRREKDCKDIETVQPLGAVDKAALKARIDGLDAKGETPISGALTQAAEELEGKGGTGSIVLVSDGEPSCNTPPACEVAENLKQQGLDVTIHAVGFRIKGNSRAQETLECIAESTGGTYTEAEDAQQLTEQLTAQTTRALQGYQTAGTPITGGARYEDAPLLLPGQYRDEITSHGRQEDVPELNGARFDRGDVKFYRIPLPPGHMPVLSATLAKTPEQAASEGASLVAVQPLSPPGQTSCFPYRSYDSSSMDDARGVPTTTWFDLSGTKRIMGDESLRKQCLTEEGDLVVAVYQETDLPTDAPTPLELALAYEPLRGPEGAPAPDLTGVQAPTPTAPTPVTGGTSFNDATPLEDGQTVSDSLVPGEQRYYTIEAGVNQDVLTRLDFTQDAEQPRVVMASLFNPLREPMVLANAATNWHGGFSLGTIDASPGDTAFNHLRHPIHPNRRLKGVNELAGDSISVPGPQYIVVSRKFDADAPATPLPFELTAATAGTPEGAGPEFITTAEQFTQKFGGPEGAAATGPESEGNGSAEGSGAPSDRSETDTASRAPAEDSGEATEELRGDEQRDDEAEDSPGVLPWLLGGAGLLAVGLGALLLGRRSAR
ncbi:VWA domain-containing protein [Micrococcus luteus]|uniref:VWA domain-containing protein n=1 Tax=Micrococcus luteus TaxID=1270 RepID=UPI001910C06E|nr:VWA domain-containing protein [Micrococcus luteus]QQE49365.1 VWA domain-containing protein [Micrococcus luteus]